MLALMRLILEGMHIQYKDRSVMRFYSRKRDVIIDSLSTLCRNIRRRTINRYTIVQRTFFIICRGLSEWKFKKTKSFELNKTRD